MSAPHEWDLPYMAGEAIPAGAAVVVRPDGKVYCARTVAEQFAHDQGYRQGHADGLAAGVASYRLQGPGRQRLHVHLEWPGGHSYAFDLEGGAVTNQEWCTPAGSKRSHEKSWSEHPTITVTDTTNRGATP